jgi:hypothetical protein
MNLVSQDSVGSDINLPNGFVPSLQREDGSYIGTGEQSKLMAVALDGTPVWQTKINPDSNGNATAVTPLYAPADGGAIVTSTTTDSQGNTQLGALYTVDKDGNVTGQSPDTGAVTSWSGRWYGESSSPSSSSSMRVSTNASIALPSIGITSFAFSPITWTSSFWPHFDGNPSRIHAGSFFTKEIVIIAGIKKDAVPFPPIGSVSSGLLLGLNGMNKSLCALTLGNLLLGDRRIITNEFDRQYANAFLIANSANFVNSPNGEPPMDINPEDVLKGGDFRAFNRVQVAINYSGNNITSAVPLNRVAVLGNTVDSCTSSFTPSSSLRTEEHPDNGKYGITLSKTHFFHLTEGRLGREAQKINMTINGCTSTTFSPLLGTTVCNAPPGPTVAYIFSYPLFDTNRGYTINNQIFPSYFIYENGKRVNKIIQHPVEDFIKLNSGSQIKANGIP